MTDKPDIIWGWPNPTKDQWVLFQRNNGLKPDGIPGPLTRAKEWPEEKEGSVPTVFSAHRYGHYKAVESQKFLAGFDLTHEALPAKAWLTLFEIVSSQWSTGCDWLTGEDGITIGCKRWAASGLKKILKALDEDVLEDHFGNLVGQLENIQDKPTGGWPLKDMSMRKCFLSLMVDRAWWAHQVRYSVDEWTTDILDRFPSWKHGRTIALGARVKNSSPAFLSSLPMTEDAAYKEMCKRYKTRSNGASRIATIEELIPKEEVWR